MQYCSSGVLQFRGQLKCLGDSQYNIPKVGNIVLLGCYLQS